MGHCWVKICHISQDGPKLMWLNFYKISFFFLMHFQLSELLLLAKKITEIMKNLILIIKIPDWNA